MEAAVPASKISALSSGEFVGTIADDPDNKIELKAFHCEIINDHEALKAEENGYKPIPIIRKVDNTMVQRNYLQIKQEVLDIVDSEKERMADDPSLQALIVRKNR